MIKCNVPQDILRYQNKSILIFTPKQAAFLLAGFVPGAILGVLSYMIFKSSTLLLVSLAICLVPAIFLGFYSRNNLTGMNFIKLYADTYLKNPPVRTFKSEYLRGIVTEFDVPHGIESPKKKKKNDNVNNIKSYT